MHEAKSWDDYLENVYPEVQKELSKGPQNIRVCLPITAKDKTKEEMFKQRVAEDSEKAIEKLSKRRRLRNYLQSFRGPVGGLHFNTITGIPVFSFLYAIHPFLSPLALGYVTLSECMAYKDGKKEIGKIIEKLRNLKNNIFVSYSERI